MERKAENKILGENIWEREKVWGSSENFLNTDFDHASTIFIPALIMGFEETETAVSAAPFRGCLSTIPSQ